MGAAIPLAAARVYAPWGIRHIAIAYIEIIRAVPPLMLIYWVFFTFPALTGREISPYGAGVTSLFMMASASLAEVIRAGLMSVPAGQIEGGLSTGLSSLQVFVYITLPQGLRNMVPAVIAQFVSLFKTTSLVYVVGLVDFFRAIIIVNNAKFAPYALYATMAIGYFVCCYLLSWLIRRIDPTYQLTE
jgi:polar amino acid transport system permease protein